MIRIKFTPTEVDQAWSETMGRQQAVNARAAQQDIPRQVRREFFWELIGVYGEMAVAKHYDLPNQGFGEYKSSTGPDVGNDLQVRSTNGNGPLRIRERDLKKRPSTIFVLCHVYEAFQNEVTVNLAGWQTLENAYNEGVEEIFPGSTQKVWALPYKDLRPIAHLRRELVA